MKKILSILFGKIGIAIILTIMQILLFISIFTGLNEYNEIISTVFFVISLIMFFIIILSNKNPAYKISWIILIGALPVFGGILFIILSDKKPSAKLREKINNSEQIILKQLKELGYSNLELRLDKRMKSITDYIKNMGNFFVHQDTDVRYFCLGEDMYASMLEDLKKAEKFIFFEYFIVAEGKMWEGIKKILIDKSKQGLDVRVMYDDIGCMGVLPKNFKGELESHNIKVVSFNPVMPFISVIINNRNHRKILVIDGNIGYNGGVNIADEYINEIKRLGHWKDTAIRLEGTAVINLTAMFLSVWNAYKEDINLNIANYAPTVRFQNASGYVQPFSDSPLDNETVSENLYMDILWQAKDYVYIFSPYLVIDNEMAVALTMASKRGVDVRIVLPKIPDKKAVYNLAQTYFEMLMDAGIKIYLYTPGFIHAKSFVSDDRIAVVGTINMDYRSLYLHFECGTILIDNDVIKDIKNDALKTFELSEEVCDNYKAKGILNLIYQGALKILSPLF